MGRKIDFVLEKLKSALKLFDRDPLAGEDALLEVRLMTQLVQGECKHGTYRTVIIFKTSMIICSECEKTLHGPEK